MLDEDDSPVLDGIGVAAKVLDATESASIAPMNALANDFLFINDPP